MMAMVELNHARQSSATVIAAMTDDSRERFDVELRAAELSLPPADYEALYEMWCDWLPQRAALRAWAPHPDDEPWR